MTIIFSANTPKEIASSFVKLELATILSTLLSTFKTLLFNNDPLL